jgi:ATP-binding cassette subfamily B protein
MIAVLVQNIPTNYIHTWLYAKTVRTVEKELREALVCKLQQLSITYHKEMQSGRLQSKIMRDVEQIQNLASQIFISLVTIILNIGVSFGVVIFKSRIVFLFFLCTIPVSVLIIVGFKGKIKTHNRAFRKEMEETSAKVMEMVEMIQTYFSSISWVAFQIFQVFCLVFTAYIAWKGIIGVGDITLYQTYFSSIVAQIASIVTLLPIIAKGLESVESIGDVLCANDIEDNRRKKKIVDLKGEITFQDVSFTYKDDEKPVLSHLNFKIQPGETVAFAGGSGSGKTTILNLAIGFLKADSGQVLVDGNDLMELDLHSYRKQIAVVPQQSILFTGTLRENITYGSESISEEQLWNVIRAANLEEVVQKLPDGLDTMITEHGENLSGGQRQRISIARAFLRNPKILILDEATSALDNISEKKIQDSIQKLVKGRTTLIVAHRLSTIRNADRIAVIEKGNVLECGSYEELIEKKGAFYRMEKM